MAVTPAQPHRGHSPGDGNTSGPPPRMPTDITPGLGMFDRFATHASNFFSKAWFFSMCVVLVLVWAPSYFLIGELDTWQLIINTATTIVTFLMVALLQNTQTRADNAAQHKLNAIADALADLMSHVAEADNQPGLHTDVEQLKAAVGLETREGS
ncbi:low affinity iron permease family protein [Catellatospora paridis]|uniref:low affinity iron permease family protein n=1 Tax=Catellatospora paridis TaxID=1617086 RepID=UPI001E475FD5|nr:low affinity iron permease family protein [Catellatospora paridis]